MRRLRERIQESNSLGVPRREDSSLGTIEDLLERGVATGDQIINALCSQKVIVLYMGGGGLACLVVPTLAVNIRNVSSLRLISKVYDITGQIDKVWSPCMLSPVPSL